MLLGNLKGGNMAQNDVVDKKTPETLEKLQEKNIDFDEEEAYYELCEIIAMARQTGDYVRFQNDLQEWKKFYPIESFSEKYKSKIKYLLSEQFLNSILKDYLIFVKCSQMDPSKQLDKLKKIYHRAEQHKDGKKLDSELKAFYQDYPLKYLKDKFPHIIAKLTSNSYREKVLQKFDSTEAYDEFAKLVYDSHHYSSLEDLKVDLKPLQEKYPLEDFSPDYRQKIEVLLQEDFLKQIIESKESSSELNLDDLASGTVIRLDDEEKTSSSNYTGILNQKTAYFELLEIMKNPNNVNGIFNWTYTYMKYIGKFDDYHKGLILSTLLPYYPFPKQNHYHIPIMKSNGHLSFDEYLSIHEIKKASIFQFLAIISTKGNLANIDMERLESIHTNSVKAEIITVISDELDVFGQKVEDSSISLTLSDPSYFKQKKKGTSSDDDDGISFVPLETEDNDLSPLKHDSTSLENTNSSSTDLKNSSSDSEGCTNNPRVMEKDDKSSQESNGIEDNPSTNSEVQNTVYQIIPLEEDSPPLEHSRNTKRNPEKKQPHVIPSPLIDERENNPNPPPSPAPDFEITRDFLSWTKDTFEEDCERG